MENIYKRDGDLNENGYDFDTSNSMTLIVEGEVWFEVGLK